MGRDDEKQRTQPAKAKTDGDDDSSDVSCTLSGFFRGVAAATRKAAMAARKVAIAKAPAAKQAARAVGENRPLAFASEGAVAGDALLPRSIYYGAWALSGTAILADIYTKQDKAPKDLKLNTAIYWTAFHVPASLVVPAVIIHRIVHAVENSVQNANFAKSWPPRAKALAPVGAALLSIVPVVPAVDYTAEAIMEPTLGSYLGLTFDDHHHNPDKEKEE